MNLPTEEYEQSQLVQYCRINNLPCFRVPNETYTTSWHQKLKNKRLGVSAGVPDLFVIVNNHLIAIEMKRRKGSTTTQAQKEWLGHLNNCGIPARVCRGCDEAISFIQSVKLT